MNFDEIQKTWQSPHNRPSTDQLKRDKMKFISDLKRRNRGLVQGISLIFAAMTLLTGKIVFHLFWPNPSIDKIDLSREWAFVLLLALPWAGAIFFLRQYRCNKAKHPNYERSIADSLRALIDQNAASLSRKKTMFYMHAVGIPVLALCIFQIYNVGKARPHELASMVLVFSFAVAISLAGITYSLFRELAEQRRLEALLRAYKSEEI